MGKIETLSKDLLEHWDQTHRMQLHEVSVPNLSFLYEEAMGTVSAQRKATKAAETSKRSAPGL